MGEHEFEPKIMGFLCSWCSYSGADMAGVGRMQYPANIRVVRVMCSGRMNPLFVIKAFETGADGVLVSGCHPGDCHYTTGNYYTRRRFVAMRRLLDFLGIEPERLKVTWVSGSEGARFAEITREFTRELRELGPLVLSRRQGRGGEQRIEDRRPIGDKERGDKGPGDRGPVAAMRYRGPRIGEK